MFQPASLKGISPTPVDEEIRKRYLFLYIINIMFSFFPFSVYELFYYSWLWNSQYYILFFILIPFNFLIGIYIIQFSAVIFASFLIALLNLMHPPKEGVFDRSRFNKDYLFWNVRNLIKKWSLLVSASNPFPWCKNRFMLRFFGTRIGSRTLCDNSWISPEYVSIGKNVIIGMGSVILSHGLEQEKLIIKKVCIEDNVLIGAKCVLLPGTVIKKNSCLSAHSYTDRDEILEENGVYWGHPARLKTNS